MTAISTTQKIRTLCEEGLKVRSARTAAEFFDTVRTLASGHDCGTFQAIARIAEQGYLDAEMGIVAECIDFQKFRRSFEKIIVFINGDLNEYHVESILERLANKIEDEDSRKIMKYLIDTFEYENACLILLSEGLNDEDRMIVMEIQSII